MARKARGAKGRMASPAQMARLEALAQRPLSPSMPYFTWRHLMRSHMNPESNGETERAAWAHLDRRNKANIAKVQDRFRAMREDALARDTPPREPKV